MNDRKCLYIKSYHSLRKAQTHSDTIIDNKCEFMYNCSCVKSDGYLKENKKFLSFLIEINLSSHIIQ